MAELIALMSAKLRSGEREAAPLLRAYTGGAAEGRRFASHTQDWVPSVAFTIPPIASVGLTESHAGCKG